MSITERDAKDRAKLAEQIARKEAELDQLKARLADWEEAWQTAPKRDDTFTTL
ncbi:MAG: hypothetical protein GWN32_02825, partial [Gemmatimonadetes bacterium]|nr:hypothetical protein [Gemmatimonadota bacterium]